MSPPGKGGPSREHPPAIAPAANNPIVRLDIELTPVQGDACLVNAPTLAGGRHRDASGRRYRAVTPGLLPGGQHGAGASRNASALPRVRAFSAMVGANEFADSATAAERSRVESAHVSRTCSTCHVPVSSSKLATPHCTAPNGSPSDPAL